MLSRQSVKNQIIEAAEMLKRSKRSERRYVVNKRNGLLAAVRNPSHNITNNCTNFNESVTEILSEVVRASSPDAESDIDSECDGSFL